MAVAGPGFPVVCVLFACAEFRVVCVFVRSSMLSVCLSGVLTLVQKLPIVSLSCSSTLHHPPLSRRLHHLESRLGSEVGHFWFVGSKFADDVSKFPVTKVRQ